MLSSELGGESTPHKNNQKCSNKFVENWTIYERSNFEKGQIFPLGSFSDNKQKFTDYIEIIY